MPKGRRATWTAAIALVLAGSGTAHAQLGLSLNRAGSGARAAGMGDAFIAVSDDGTAASWNPAGLAQLRQPEFSAVYGVSHRGLQFTGLRSPDQTVAFSSQKFKYTDASLEFASAAIPFSLARKPVTVQVGWHRLYQLSANLAGNVQRVPLDPPGPPLLVSRDDRLVGDIDIYSAAAAVKLTSRLAVGGGLDVIRGGWTERFSVTEEMSESGGPEFASRDSTATLRGRTFTAGALLTFPSWNLGLVYHAPFWSAYRVRQTEMSSRTPAMGAELDAARFRFPRSMGIGVARRLVSRWTAAATVTHDQWTDAVVDPGHGQAVINFFDGLPPEISTSRDTVSFNAGLEHLVVREGWVAPLRIGFGWEPQGGMDRWTRDPVDYLLLTAGGGYNTNRFKFDAAVQYRRGSFSTSHTFSVRSALANALPPDAAGPAASHELRMKVSAIYRLQDVDSLKSVFKKIFG